MMYTELWKVVLRTNLLISMRRHAGTQLLKDLGQAGITEHDFVGTLQ